MNYKIYPVLQGMKKDLLDGAMFMFGSEPGTLYKIPYGFYALQGEDGRIVMVDSGIYGSEQLDRLQLAYRVEPGTLSSAEALRVRTGFDPEDVEAIIITHLHWDHCQNLEDFPNAKIYVQKKELLHAIAPYTFERNGYCMWEQTNGPSWLPSLLRFELINGEKEVLPGIHVILTPGHTEGSQSVLIDTAEGRYCSMGDYVHMMKNITECLPEGIYSSLADWYDTYPKIIALMDEGVKLLCCHETTAYERTYG